MAINQFIYKISLLLLLSAFFIIKSYFTIKYQTDEEKRRMHYPLKIKLLLAIAGIGNIFLPLLWVFTEFLMSTDFILSDMARIFGLLFYMILILVVHWQMKTLGVNISQIRKDRYLVTEGPYRYIRHPLYALFIGQTIASTLITANWLIAIFIPFVLITMLLRITYEEKLLVNDYGQDYQDYIARTKKIIPKIL